MAKTTKLPFDRRGGGMVIQRILLDSPAYIALSPQAKALMVLLHLHWTNMKPVAYGVREAAEKIPCAKDTASKAFKDLQEAGFIVMIDESVFCSRTQSKARTWRLTWLPYQNKAPTNNWEGVIDFEEARQRHKQQNREKQKKAANEN